MNTPSPRYPWKYAIFFSAFYMITASFQGFSGPFYQDARGMTDHRLIILLTCTPFVALVTQPIWGKISDRMPTRNRAMLLMAVVSIVSCVLMALSRSFVALLLSTALFAAFYLPIQPIGDSIILEDMEKHGQAFGPIRLSASVAFALANLILGAVIGTKYQMLPWIMAGMSVFLLLSLQVLPPAKGYQHGKENVPIKALLAQPYMKSLLALLTILMLALGYFYAFYSLHVTALPGGNARWVGVGYFISAAVEIPFLLTADRLFKKYGVGRLMLVSCVLLLVRFLILATTRSVLIATLSQLLHAGCFVVITLSMSYYVNRVVPNELRASGQMLLSVVGYGLARVFGTVGGGLIARLMGGTAGGFALMAAVCAVTLLWAAPLYLRVPPINGEKKA